MTKTYPVIRVNELKSRFIWKGTDADGLIVRVQDLISPVTLAWNKTYYDILKAGGIHKYLGFNGDIVLSLVMKDWYILFFKAINYAEAINALAPDKYTTPDCETYERGKDILIDGEGYYAESLAWKEIKRSLTLTEKLLELCPNSKPIGHVKGINQIQLNYHAYNLRQLGIVEMTIHCGDFFRNGSPRMISKAKSAAAIARKYCEKLYLLGFSSQRRIQEFSFADVYGTFGYYVQAHNGKKYVGTRTVEYINEDSMSVAKHNLKQMLNNTKRLKYQKKLFKGGVCQWEEEHQAEEHIMQQQEAAPSQTIQAH